ncbi:cytochrome P450 [Verticillium alfalfae VaMs.102]|uniref:Cytochrome P450 n=1 Tax=Verticillium alfalfae (strain VaMs.102 / ATCC MYA-4576 / FGSC 10136) TaxID=526221 RepID=C9SF51_VERA1|nr:cytochrome P450 [Verticillium alfalfae VaMs.102]EEY17837.1 cytochrome P450 [Verticillium alfalfae VaMs.102]
MIAAIARFSPLVRPLQPWHVIAAVIFISIAILVSATLLSIAFGIQYPSNVPRIREKPGAGHFSLRTRLAYYIDCEALFREAYEKYGKFGRTVLVPGLGLRTEVILPPSALRWMLSLQDSSISSSHAFVELDQLTYTLGEDRLLIDSWNALIVKRDMNAVLEKVAAVLNDELRVAFDEQFGTDTETWREVDLNKVMPLIISQAAGRYTMGLPLCRDEEYRQSTIDVSNFFLTMAAVMGMVPVFLKPILGPLAALPMNAALRKFHNLVRPEFNKRMDMIQAAEKGEPVDEPEDLLQMAIRYGLAHRSHEFSFLEISKRMTITNMGTTHQTNMTMINMMLEIIDSDAEFNTIAVLRDEMRNVLGDGQDIKWTKAKIAQMVKADSVGRETLRKTSFGNRAMLRMVIADSLETPDGVVLPKGSMLSVLTPPQHFDEATHEDAGKFDPFRFSRAREGEATKSGALGFTSTGAHFLPFGHGRHACPGRFLVDYEMKMIMTYILQNYDIEFPEEYRGRRPQQKWQAEARLTPSDGARIRVKRRRVAP